MANTEWGLRLYWRILVVLVRVSGLWELLSFPCSMPLEGETVVARIKKRQRCQASIITTNCDTSTWRNEWRQLADLEEPVFLQGPSHQVSSPIRSVEPSNTSGVHSKGKISTASIFSQSHNYSLSGGQFEEDDGELETLRLFRDYSHLLGKYGLAVPVEIHRSWFNLEI